MSARIEAEARAGLLSRGFLILASGCAAVFGCCGTSLAQAADRASAPNPAARVALIVGIDRYAPTEVGEGLPDLRGCGNDADAAAALLVGRFGFAMEDVVLLVDDQATHEAIVRAFREHLIESSGPGTEAVFWFSGHGSRAEDLSGIPGAEVGGQDSTLVAWDSRKAGFDLSDDELHSLLQALCARTSRVTAILDSCHSGGATRGPASSLPRSAISASRAVRFEDLAAFWPDDLPFLDDGHPERLEELPVVTISACAYDQQAEELRVRSGSGRWHWFGAMSYHLVAAMERMRPGTSFDALARDTALRVSARFQDQYVQAEGPVARVAFSGEFAEPLPGFAGTAVAGSPSVEVEAGAFHLLAAGSVLRALDLTGRSLGLVRVEEVEAYHSWAVWLEEPEGLGELVPVRLVLVGAPAGEPLRLTVEPAALASGIQAAWASGVGPATRVVDGVDEAADFLLRQRADGGWTLLALPEERPIWSGGAAADPAQLAREAGAILTSELRYSRLMELAGAGGGISLSMSVGAPEAGVLESTRFPGAVAPQPVEMRWPQAGRSAGASGAVPILVDRHGAMDLMELTVEFDAPTDEDPVHLSILCVSADRTVSLVYPPPSQRHEGLIEPGIPKKVRVEVFLNPGWDEQKPLRDRYLAIATVGFADFSALQVGMQVAASGAALAAAQKRSGGRPVPSILLEALQADTLRGGPLQGPEDWRFGIAAADVLVIQEAQD